MKAPKRLDLQLLTAPIDGKMANLAVWTADGVVKPETLLNVVPLPPRSGKVLNRDRLRLDGPAHQREIRRLPLTRYNTVDGEVTEMSRDANKDDRQGLVYRVHVRLDATDIDVDGKRVAVAPDMAVAAEIMTCDRRVIDDILSPTVS